MYKETPHPSPSCKTKNPVNNGDRNARSILLNIYCWVMSYLPGGSMCEPGDVGDADLCSNGCDTSHSWPICVVNALYEYKKIFLPKTLLQLYDTYTQQVSVPSPLMFIEYNCSRGKEGYIQSKECHGWLELDRGKYYGKVLLSALLIQALFNVLEFWAQWVTNTEVTTLLYYLCRWTSERLIYSWNNLFGR